MFLVIYMTQEKEIITSTTATDDLQQTASYRTSAGSSNVRTVSKTCYKEFHTLYDAEMFAVKVNGKVHY